MGPPSERNTDDTPEKTREEPCLQTESFETP